LRFLGRRQPGGNGTPEPQVTPVAHDASPGTLTPKGPHPWDIRAVSTEPSARTASHGSTPGARKHQGSHPGQSRQHDLTGPYRLSLLSIIVVID